ncbi:MAG: hypothetical protein BWY13_00147 [Euryarchaeota archaeon ADurb.Bin190]|nr:MAG: hypothetical protein BWY13_00147 [Euryarchaeota archaeon ADurb.Bin190]
MSISAKPITPRPILRDWSVACSISGKGKRLTSITSSRKRTARATRSPSLSQSTSPSFTIRERLMEPRLQDS